MDYLNYNVKKFHLFCESVQIKVPENLKNTELLNLEYKKNTDEFNNFIDSIYFKLKFNDFITPSEFIFIYKEIKSKKDIFKIEVDFIMSKIQYTKESIIDFINVLINEKNKFNKILKLNLNEILELKNNELIIKLDNNEFNYYKEIFESIHEKIKKFGFKEIIFTFIKNEEKQEYVLEENIQEKNEKIKKMLDHFSNKAIEITKNNSYPENKFRNPKKTFANINYQNISLEKIKDVDNNSYVSFVGEVFKKDKKPVYRNGQSSFTFYVSNYKEAVKCNWYSKGEFKREDLDLIEIGNWVKINAQIPSLERVSRGFFVYVNTITSSNSLFEINIDNNPIKRIELHACSKMNTMDGLMQPNEIVERAKKLGMSSVGIMDLDGVQGYPEFYLACKKNNIKGIYGATYSVIDDYNKSVYGPILKGNISDFEFVSFDIETTGLSPRFHELIEFGSITVDTNLRKKDKNQFFAKPKNKLSQFTIDLTKITDKLIEDEGFSIKESLLKIYDILNNKVALAHNARFDYNFLKEQFRLNEIPFPNVTVIDTLAISRMLNPEKRSHKLGQVANRLGIDYDSEIAHRADYDANVLADIWINLLNELKKININTFEDLTKYTSKEFESRKYPNEISTIIKNTNGLKEQYKLITKSLTENYNNGPKTYLSTIQNINRNNILIGSGTLKSRLYDKYFYSCQEDFLKELEIYDFIEILPPQNMKHFVDRNIITENDLLKGIEEIIHFAKKMNKLVIATSDARYLDDKDKEFFKTLVYAKGIKNVRHYLYDSDFKYDLPLPDQKFLNTQEMIDSFNFLNNKELVNEIVIENPNKINEMTEDLQIIKEGLFTPKFDNSDVKLREYVYKTAHEIYGENLPPLIKDRIEAEINPIINYGFSVIYWITHKLVKMSVDQGYVVGSRGSVGSSFVATLSGISQVNPLPPHYICKKCKFFELVENPEVRNGYDLDDKECNNCGELVKGEGHNIPFETFLGFKADKVPDIDLNFSGEFQGKIHDEIKNIFGENHTFRAGTIQTVAEKTGYGYAKNYMEEVNKDFSDSFALFIGTKLEKIKRTTGQHPGGVIIIPKEFEVYDFTPVNYPANDTESSWFTTHFDYHAIHDNVLKFDMLGHDNPTIIRKLQEYTGVSVDDIPHKDEKVIESFINIEALSIKKEQVQNEPTGALGIPEFGTNFVRQMLVQAKPKSFADLVSVSGLSHGENVWLENAQDLILKQGLKIDDVISCREDIMYMLINKGVENSLAFKIMEKIRKGKGLTDEEIDLLKNHNVPEWQIKSMNKIVYLFPKAHAVAYVLMAWWISWFKVYYPLAFYASYFASHARAIDISNMVDKRNGTKVTTKLIELKNKNSDLISTKEKDLIPVLEITEELYARGMYIEQIDIEKSQAHEWIVDNDKNCLIPPFDSIDGLGPAVAESIVQARNESPFKSKEDFKNRTDVNKTLFETIKAMGILKNLNDTDQFTLF
ncbi:DNA polymerase III polC-type [Mycoplasmopsis maculosa]|uniref:DNA polymerase III PolC-type n=1 Tax=Mycoplasmopsis maculosa TaxID=114885 RepID=A0A449B538_9BACT|nr:PolC-type DNA polymerase III [Mycoplasmopsis maculosa]VEU75689.1 DNA polymerase III polC-type [Mycoplasmopsis maculosa]